MHQKMSLYWICYAVLFSLFLQACGGDNLSKEDMSDNTRSQKNPVDNKITYFGFAGVDCFFDDPQDSAEKTNYIDEVADFTNIAHMCISDIEENISLRLSEYNRNGIKAMLHIEPLFFNRTNDSSTGSGTRLDLRDDALILWEKFLEINRINLTTDNIATIYLADEPAWNGMTYDDLAEAARIIKSSLPDIPIMMIEAYPMVDQLLVTDNIDWIGFDRYDVIDPKNDVAWIADLETLINAKTHPDQKIVIVASTQWLPFYTDAGVSPESVEQIVQSYYEVALQYPDVVAVIGYLWPGGLDSPEQLGARNLPENVQIKLKNIGKEILGQK